MASLKTGKPKNKGRWTNGDYRHFTDEHRKRDATVTPPEPQAHLVTPAASAPSAASSVISQATTQQHGNTHMSLTELLQQMTQHGS